MQNQCHTYIKRNRIYKFSIKNLHFVQTKKRCRSFCWKSINFAFFSYYIKLHCYQFDNIILSQIDSFELFLKLKKSVNSFLFIQPHFLHQNMLMFINVVETENYAMIKTHPTLDRFDKKWKLLSLYRSSSAVECVYLFLFAF